MIFIDVRNTEISVTGSTYSIRSKLGQNGLGLRFNKDKQQWTGSVSLKALEFLQAQSGAMLGPKAQDAMAEFRLAARKRADYMASRRAN